MALNYRTLPMIKIVRDELKEQLDDLAPACEDTALLDMACKDLRAAIRKLDVTLEAGREVEVTYG